MKTKFSKPEEIKSEYSEIISVYQKAFASPPWNERTKCLDLYQRCDSMYSPLNLGELCVDCGQCPTEIAYKDSELIRRFDDIASTRPAYWYSERTSMGLTLAALAWSASPEKIAIEKYGDKPDMKLWLSETINEDEVTWLDEVFSDKSVKPHGNLRNFGNFVIGLANRLDTSKVIYRTIEPKMISVAMRDFGNAASVEMNVPDNRSFVIIDLEKIV